MNKEKIRRIFTANQHILTRTKKNWTKSSWFLCGSWLINLFLILFPSYIFAQPHHAPGGRDDTAPALRYAQYVKQLIDEKKRDEALAASARTGDFANVSSDVSYQRAFILSQYSHGVNRNVIVEYLQKAIDTNRWMIYSENAALLLKAEKLIALRKYSDVFAVLDKIGGNEISAQTRADAEMLRLYALRGMAHNGDLNALAQFRSLTLTAMDRFSRDPRPLRIFFEYARGRMSFSPNVFHIPFYNNITDGDFSLMELALRRLPFLLEADTDLAWLASPFIRNLDDARRLTSTYRAGGIPNIQNRDFMPRPESIPLALNLGLIDDRRATEELFSGSRGFNYPLPEGIAPNGNPALDKDVIADVYALLRSEEGRDNFTRKLLAFSGVIFSDEDRDGYIDNFAVYDSGAVIVYEIDKDQSNDFHFKYYISGGSLLSAKIHLTGQAADLLINWERYPSVADAELNSSMPRNKELFTFRPAEFQYHPVSFIELGGSQKLSGLLYPVTEYENAGISYRTLVLFCSTLTRNSPEFDNAEETFFMEKGVPLKAVEYVFGEILNGDSLSITEFERGLPVIQYIDLDLDGRKETIRRFRRPAVRYDLDFLKYRGLIASCESDWSGDGRHKTKEVYLEDGSVVYSIDADGSGVYNYPETGNQR